MPSHFKALIVVMVITLISFMVCKPVFTRFMAVEDFKRRRNIWLVLTAAAFLAPNFWVSAAVAIPLLLYGAKKDSNSAALYFFLLLAVPPFREQIPTLGIAKQIFPLDHFRLLSLFLLLPVGLMLRRRHQAMVPGEEASTPGLRSADVLLLCFAALQVVLMAPYESVTAVIRRALLLSLDLLLPYFVISRVCVRRDMIVEALAGFAMAMAVLVPLAVFEMLQSWMLFADIERNWGVGHVYFVLRRGDYLRAQVTAGHSIVLGFAMAVGFGTWLYLQNQVPGRFWRWLGLLAFTAGMVASFARGPWVCAVAILFVYLSVGPNAGRRFFKGAAWSLALAAAALASPWGEKIINLLPFVGNVDVETIVYRQRLAETSWLLIQQNLIFGSPYFLSYMEELRQGQGIIDLVNAYATVALGYGLVGFGLFVGFYSTVIVATFRTVRRYSFFDHDFAMLGAPLIACLVGAMLIIATSPNYLSIPYIHLTLAALAVAYVKLGKLEDVATPYYGSTSVAAA